MNYGYVLLAFVSFKYGLCLPDIHMCEDMRVNRQSELVSITNPITKTGSTFTLHISHEASNYTLETDLHFVAAIHQTEDENNIICLGLLHLVIITKSQNTNKALLVIQTNSSIPAGLLQINMPCLMNKGNFTLCTESISLLIGVIINPMLVTSPLTAIFWDHLRDLHLLYTSWINRFSLAIFDGSIPAPWITNLQLNSLTELFISGNKWGSPETLLGSLPNLKKLFLPKNNIATLPNDTFELAPQVDHLELQDNNMTSIPCGTSRLKYIDLSHQSSTSFITISDDDASHLQDVEHLHINSPLHTNITTIFTLPKLKSLLCSGCSLWKFPENNLFKNNFYSSLGNVTSDGLTVLSLDNNWIEHCPYSELGALTNLEKLILSRNNLTHISSRCFKNLHNLCYLDLSWNQINNIGSSAFDALGRLQYLDLSNNHLTVIHENVLSPLNGLIYLNISFNHLIEEPIIGDSELNVVDLSNNSITSISNMTNFVKYIKYLNISNNGIVKLQFTKVERLNLSYNAMDTVPNSMWSYFQTLSQLDLGGNPFDCCHNNLPSLQKKINDFRKIISNLNTDKPLTCSPNSQSATVILQDFVNNGTLCSISLASLAMHIAVPLGVLSMFVIIFVLVLHYYRSEFTYIKHILEMKESGLQEDEAMSADCMYDAFVCYSHKNYSWVTGQLIRNLEKGPEGYRFCLHDRDFTIGAPIDKNIIESLKKSRKVIIVLTKDFVASRWCQWELTMAKHKMFKEGRNFIILIELEKPNHEDLPIDLEFLMDTRTYLEWPQEFDEQRIQRCWQRLRNALGKSIQQRTGKEEQKCSVLDL